MLSLLYMDEKFWSIIYVVSCTHDLGKKDLSINDSEWMLCWRIICVVLHMDERKHLQLSEVFRLIAYVFVAYCFFLNQNCVPKSALLYDPERSYPCS